MKTKTIDRLLAETNERQHYFRAVYGQREKETQDWLCAMNNILKKEKKRKKKKKVSKMICEFDNEIEPKMFYSFETSIDTCGNIGDMVNVTSHGIEFVGRVIKIDVVGKTVKWELESITSKQAKAEYDRLINETPIGKLSIDQIKDYLNIFTVKR